MVGLGCAIFFCALAAFAPQLLEQLDLRIQDAKFRLRGARPASREIVIVEINRSSIRELGRWPWSRARIAGLVNAVAAGKPRAIGLDILFSEPGLQPDEDRELARALSKAGNVVLSYYFILSRKEAQEQSPDAHERQLGYISKSAVEVVSNLAGTEQEADCLHADGLEANTPQISDAAAALGYYNVTLGPDGAVRSLPMTIRAGGKYFLPFSLAVLKVYQGMPTGVLFLDGRSVLSLQLPPRTVLASAGGTAVINYCGAGGSFTSYSAADVLKGAAPDGAFTGKIVLIGGTSMADFEMRATPFSMLTPSVMIQANAIDNALHGNFLAAIACLGLLPGIMLPRVPRIAYGALLIAAACFLWLLFDFYLFAAANILLKTIYPILSLAASYMAVSLLAGVSQERNERILASGMQAMAEVISASPDVENLLPKALGMLLQFVNGMRGFILLRRRDGGGERWGSWAFTAAQGMGDTAQGRASFTPYLKLITEVEKSGLPIFIPRRAWKKADIPGAGNGEQYRPDFFLCLPLSVRGRLMGIAYADGEAAPPHISARSLPILMSLAGQLGTAIENASLYSEVTEAKERAAGEEVYAGGEIMRDVRFKEIIGSAESMRGVLELVERAAAGDSPVLIEGETGTGKELIARAIHYYGPRCGMTFVAQNCAALPEALLESELFGHVRGAFTGAVSDKKGLLAIADGGTVFLDEITECSPAVQAKLLRFLQDGVIRPVGSVREARLNVRVISATNRSLEEEVARGAFRKDLLYRLNVFPIRVPPLRERRQDIPLLAASFLRTYGEKAGKSLEGFTNEAMRLLMAHDFPGNVRELENEMERIVAMHREGKLVTADDLSDKIRAREREKLGIASDLSGKTLKELIREVEREIILTTLKSCDGNVTQAAIRLGMSRYGLYKKISDHGLTPSSQE
jgi:transcriptional regulator with GAF, ATPase, and Fis domain/CHASE2 domain-containing sensor protein